MASKLVRGLGVILGLKRFSPTRAAALTYCDSRVSYLPLFWSRHIPVAAFSTRLESNRRRSTTIGCSYPTWRHPRHWLPCSLLYPWQLGAVGRTCSDLTLTHTTRLPPAVLVAERCVNGCRRRTTSISKSSRALRLLPAWLRTYPRTFALTMKLGLFVLELLPVKVLTDMFASPHFPTPRRALFTANMMGGMDTRGEH